jgi:hypothetical protein
VLDVAQAGSYAHLLRHYWSNQGDPANVSDLKGVERPPGEPREDHACFALPRLLADATPGAIVWVVSPRDHTGSRMVTGAGWTVPPVEGAYSSDAWIME